MTSVRLYMRSLSSCRLIHAIALAGVLGAVACTGNDRPSDIYEPNLGGSASGLTGASTTDSKKGSGGSKSTDQESTTGVELSDRPKPSVEVLAPEEDEVVGDTIQLRCSVRQNEEDQSFPVNVTSIEARVEDDSGEVVLTRAMSPAEGDFEYEVELFLTDLDAGKYRIGCAASDAGMEPVEGSAEVSVLLDRGPTIEVISPAPNSALSSAQKVNFEFKITGAPLFDGDEEASVESDPTIMIGGVEFSLTLKEGTEDIYWLEALDLADAMVFNPIPADLTLVTVSAANERGIIRELAFSVIVDSAGPVLTVLSPESGAIVGNEFALVLKVVDDLSGVEWNSLKITASGIELSYDSDDERWSQSGDTVTLVLETSQFVDSQFSIQATVNDAAGNASVQNGSVTYHLDQVAPVISLTPPNFRAVDEDEGYCSHSFDPVGNGAVNNGDLTTSYVLFRALTFDRTNPSPTYEWLSAVDSTSVRLWLMKAGEALVVDTTGDNICDNVQTDLAEVITLDPITGLGTPYYGSGEGDLLEPDVCGYKEGTSAPLPPALCDETSDLSFVVTASKDQKSAPALYAPLVNPNAFTCTGEHLSLGPLFGNYEGWICAAARAYDNLGNRGVSEAIAFCMDNLSVQGTPDCSGPPPSCTDGCLALGFSGDELFPVVP